MAHYMMAVYGTLYDGSLWHIIFWQFMTHYILAVYDTLYFGSLWHIIYKKLDELHNKHLLLFNKTLISDTAYDMKKIKI